MEAEDGYFSEASKMEEARWKAEFKRRSRGTKIGMSRWMRLFQCPRCGLKHWYSIRPRSGGVMHSHYMKGRCPRCYPDHVVMIRVSDARMKLNMREFRK